MGTFSPIGFLGMRGDGDWVSGQRPLNWRQQILYLYPNGMAPLTAILSMMNSEAVDDPQYNWWTQIQASIGGAASAAYTTPDLGTAYSAGGQSGSILYFTISIALSQLVRIGHEILLRDSADWRVDTVGKVVNVSRGSALATLCVKLLQQDQGDAQGIGHNLANCNTFKIIGNINPEGGEMPEAIALQPQKLFNYTQIFRTPLAITRTARKTHLRTGDQYQKAKAEALEMHSWEMEQAFIFGIPTELIGGNSKPERTTQGIISFIRANMPANCVDFTLDTSTYMGLTWLQGGQQWLEQYLEQIFRYGADEKLVLCGSGALLGIQQLGEVKGLLQLQPPPKVYGMDIRRYVTPFGVVNFKTHPLFSYDVTTRYMALVIEPREITYRFIDDTAFYGEDMGEHLHPEGYGGRRIDGTFEEFLTEAGLEFGLPYKCAVLNGVGLNNTL
jgi:hypothetical protein